MKLSGTYEKHKCEEIEMRNTANEQLFKLHINGAM